MAAAEDEERKRWPRTWGVPPPWTWGWSPGDPEAENLPRRVAQLEELEKSVKTLENYAKWGTRGVWALVGITVGLALASGELHLTELLPLLGTAAGG